MQHNHHFIEPHHEHSERMTRYVVLLTAVMMVVEIISGVLFHSMALLADGWHMFTHAGALGIAAFAYYYSRKQAKNPKFTFGTGKVNALGGLVSSIILAMIALLVIIESLSRLSKPLSINFNEAIWVTCVGLGVNLVSAWLLKGDSHHHDHKDHDDHAHDHDHNLKAAYMHVLADALTSVTAIVALFCGKFLGWVWMDPLMGIVGSIVIAIWAYGLIKTTTKVLLDHVPDTKLGSLIKEKIEVSGDCITDLHVWQIAPGKHAVILSVGSCDPKSSDDYKDKLSDIKDLVHITVEVNKI